MHQKHLRIDILITDYWLV